MDRKFYDIHYHLFDLSHTNLLAFILRDDLINNNLIRKILKKMPIVLKILPFWFLNFFPDKISKKTREYLKGDSKKFRNLLSVLECAIEYHFLYMEYFLLKDKQLFGPGKDAKYDKIVISPQLMDFGYKNLINKDCFYNVPPVKPILNQVVDVINSIWFYYNFDIIIHPQKPGRLKIIPSNLPKEKKLFEIYPFLGINTQNYDLTDIVELFDKYFNGYEHDTPVARRNKLYNKLGTVRADLVDMIFKTKEKSDGDYYNYLFAGIKLYPPLGFDPWPEDNEYELKKVRFLYSECIRKNLPVVVHCSDGGFKTSPDATKFTDPSGAWQTVLSKPEYRDLKINFAHLGNQSSGETEWRNSVLKKIREHKNIYSDCSSLTPDIEDYSIVREIMNEDNETKILFGSDFVINLLWSESYNAYLSNFLQTPYLEERYKKMMVESNPEKFLFG